jgi:hypothetical protein
MKPYNSLGRFYIIVGASLYRSRSLSCGYEMFYPLGYNAV